MCVATTVVATFVAIEISKMFPIAVGNSSWTVGYVTPAPTRIPHSDPKPIMFP